MKILAKQKQLQNTQHPHIAGKSQARSRLQCAAAVTPRSSSVGQQLLEIISEQKFGAACSKGKQEQVLQLVAQMKAAVVSSSSSSSARHGSVGDSRSSGSSLAPTEGPLEGSWRLLWTTEDSIHKLVNGQLLGAPVQDIQQHIDLSANRVTNKIQFGWLGVQLQASGPLIVKSPSRIAYSFDKLSLGLLGTMLPLPLYVRGGGWTDCVILQDGLRIMQNSRQDTLILERLTRPE